MLDKHKHTKIKNNKIQGWRLELASYSYTIQYRPGRENVGPDKDPQGERRWNPKNLSWGVVFVAVESKDLIECSTFGSTISHHTPTTFCAYKESSIFNG